MHPVIRMPSTPMFQIRRIPCRTATGRLRQHILRPLGPHGWCRTSASWSNVRTVLTWQTDPLKENVTVTGDIVADLFASTTGSDSDWMAKLIDVYPEDYQKITEENATTTGAGPVLNGYELMVANDILRGRYRNSLDTPEPITPNQVTEYKIDLHPNDHVFLKGH